MVRRGERGMSKDQKTLSPAQLAREAVQKFIRMGEAVRTKKLKVNEGSPEAAFIEIATSIGLERLKEMSASKGVPPSADEITGLKTLREIADRMRSKGKAEELIRAGELRGRIHRYAPHSDSI